MRLLALIGVLALIALVGGAGYLLTGAYDIAAANPDPAPIASILERVRNASIARHATDKPPFPEGDKNAIQQGARAFSEAGCVNCHGGPGVDWAKFAEGMNPDPPDLKDVAKARSVGQIFWVVKNGIRMTGMPSFAKAGLKDDRIWQIAAFVKAIPSVSEADYKSWSAAAPAQ